MLIKDGFFAHILKKQPDSIIWLFALFILLNSTELATNNDDLVYATYHEPKRIGDRVHAVAVA